MVASNVHISLSFIVCFIVFIHGLFHFLVPFNVLVMFIYFHLFSSTFVYVHLVSFIFIYVHFFLFIFIFHFLTITNLNHLHVDPRLSSADNRHNCRSSNAGPIHLGNHRTRSRFHACAFRYRPSLSVPRVFGRAGRPLARLNSRSCTRSWYLGSTPI